jgi:hypothetical protein
LRIQGYECALEAFGKDALHVALQIEIDVQL